MMVDSGGDGGWLGCSGGDVGGGVVDEASLPVPDGWDVGAHQEGRSHLATHHLCSNRNLITSV